jgi:hypothetical protein
MPVNSLSVPSFILSHPSYHVRRSLIDSKTPSRPKLEIELSAFSFTVWHESDS